MLWDWEFAMLRPSCEYTSSLHDASPNRGPKGRNRLVVPGLQPSEPCWFAVDLGLTAQADLCRAVCADKPLEFD